MSASVRLYRIALISIVAYASATLLSLMLAHTLLVLSPHSVLAENLIAPVARGLKFVDSHWKSILLLIGPLSLPVARGLIPRLRKAWSFEFDVPLTPVEKGTVSSEGASPK